LWCIEFKASLLFNRAVALGALHIEQGLNLGCPQSARIRPTRHGGKGQKENDRDVDAHTSSKEMTANSGKS
jgi:hypothetical protein